METRNIGFSAIKTSALKEGMKLKIPNPSECSFPESFTDCFIKKIKKGLKFNDEAINGLAGKPYTSVTLEGTKGRWKGVPIMSGHTSNEMLPFDLVGFVKKTVKSKKA